MKTAPSEFVYEDELLRMALPPYMRPKKGMRYFAGRKPQSKEAGLIAASLEVLPDALAREQRRQLRRTPPAQPSLMMEFRTVRQGDAAWCPDAVEWLVTNVNTINGDLIHNMELVFPKGPVSMLFTASGRGSFDEFDATCQKMVKSVELKSAAGL